MQHISIMTGDDTDPRFRIEIASEKHTSLAALVADTLEESAKARGTGISKRPPETIATIMRNGNALVAFDGHGTWAGFCFINPYDNGAFVSNSGLIVAPPFRDKGLARQLKRRMLELCHMKFPQASVVGITTSRTVMKINTEMGFYPATFADLPRDEKFWNGCKSCVNHDILERTGKKFCLCTAMRRDPVKQE